MFYNALLGPNHTAFWDRLIFASGIFFTPLKFALKAVPTLTTENLWDFTFTRVFRQPFEEAFTKDG